MYHINRSVMPVVYELVCGSRRYSADLAPTVTACNPPKTSLKLMAGLISTLTSTRFVVSIAIVATWFCGLTRW